MSLWDRFKVACVLSALFALISAIADAFVHSEAFNDLLFHSNMFLYMFAFFVVIAPYFVKVFGLTVGSGVSSSKETPNGVFESGRTEDGRELAVPGAASHNEKTTTLIVFFTVIGLFLAAVLLFMFVGAVRASAVLLVACGMSAMIFRHAMSAAQHYLAKSHLAPASWKEVRPLTFALWGAGVAIVGVVWFFQPA